MILDLSCMSILEDILFSSYQFLQKSGENSKLFATYCTSNISYIHSTFKMSDHALIIICRSHRMLHE